MKVRALGMPDAALLPGTVDTCSVCAVLRSDVVVLGGGSVSVAGAGTSTPGQTNTMTQPRWSSECDVHSPYLNYVCMYCWYCQSWALLVFLDLFKKKDCFPFVLMVIWLGVAFLTMTGAVRRCWFDKKCNTIIFSLFKSFGNTKSAQLRGGFLKIISVGIPTGMTTSFYGWSRHRNGFSCRRRLECRRKWSVKTRLWPMITSRTILLLPEQYYYFKNYPTGVISV